MLACMSLLVFLGVVEGAVSALCLVRRGRLDRAALAFEREQALSFAVEGLSPARQWEGELKLHPLFGYVHIPNSRGANNYGFLTPHDFDLDEKGYALRGHDHQRTMVIGVFGGSFAQQLVLAAHDRLAAGMARAYPAKDPVVVNFALEGHAIPQTAFVFLYFRSMVDIAVFVDGYNELWNYVNNTRAGCPPEYAKAAHYLFKTSKAELTPARFAQTARLLQLHRRRHALTRMSLWAPVRNSVLVHMIWTRLARHLEQAAGTQATAIEQDLQRATPFMAASDSEMVHIAANQWGAYHRMIHAVAVSEGILDLHVLQPNIYVPGNTKRLTAGERRILDADTESHRGQCLAVGYPLLQREIAGLDRQGILVADLTGVFSECEEERWVDVCHANTAGYHTVADHIVSALGAGTALRPSLMGTRDTATQLIRSDVVSGPS
ncbi:hypothetical protein JXA88_10200 [Candidatus Fermentibacteria bacterium]|nr:hypothetical protein [Candidatus Fermentibacteria bacterium]